MDGIERKILPPSCIDEQEYREQSQKQEETCRLPKSLLEAVEAFEQDELMQNVIGKELSQKIYSDEEERISGNTVHR